jgi:hypothetical protein
MREYYMVIYLFIKNIYTQTVITINPDKRRTNFDLQGGVKLKYSNAQLFLRCPPLVNFIRMRGGSRHSPPQYQGKESTR